MNRNENNKKNEKNPCLYIIIPCYNEEKVLPVTAPVFLDKIETMIRNNKISENSRIMFVNDGSEDTTWEIICELSKKNKHYIGISQSRNRGHQNAVLAGLMEAKEACDITISIDCDGQDDINAMDEMVEKFMEGNQVVYGVRCARKKDSFFKRYTAESFYKILKYMGVEVVFNHADYRLMSSRVLQEFEAYKEVNVFLRGMIPLVGFKSTIVTYERHERMAGSTHYSISNMISLALDGITSLSIRPIRMITSVGVMVSSLSFAGIIWAIVSKLMGLTVSGWASIICVICLFGGIELLALGVIGEYIGKIYLETKARPRYIISERTDKREWENE